MQGYAVKETGFHLITKNGIFPTIIKGDISLIAKKNQHLYLRIFNIAGKEIKDKDLNLTRLPAGVYFVMYKNKENKIQGIVKIILMK